MAANPDGGELEALREVPEREAMFAEQTFGFRPGDTGLQFGLAGHLIDPVQPVEAPHIQGDHRAKVVANGVKPTNDAGAATKRDHGNAVVGAVVQDVGDGVLPVGAAGQQHRVGRILDTGVFAPQQVWGGLAAGVQQPVAIGGAEILVPTMRASASWSAPDRADGRSCTCAGSSSGCSESARPTTCFSNDRTPSESGLAAAGSPHASHFIGGRSSSR